MPQLAMSIVILATLVSPMAALQKQSVKVLKEARRTGDAISQYDSDTYLTAYSPHVRYDNSPLYSMLRGETTASVSDLQASKNPIHNGAITKVEAYFDGLSIWKRYEESDLPSQAWIQDTGRLMDVIAATPGAAQESPYTQIDGVTIAPLIPTEDQQRVQDGYDSIASAGIGSCSSDVYASVSLGGDDTAITFAPGLNQLWNVLSESREDVLAWVVVGADSFDNPASVYLGSGDGVTSNSPMAFNFDSFSYKTNPMDFFVDYMSGGLPTLNMAIAHHQDDSNYIYTSVWFDSTAGTDFMNTWRTTKAPYALKIILFLQKALQIWDLCTCYWYTPGELLNCLTLASESSFFWGILGTLLTVLFNVGGFLSIITSERLAWVNSPKKFVNGAWQDCWIALSDSLTYRGLIRDIRQEYRARGGSLTRPFGNGNPYSGAARAVVCLADIEPQSLLKNSRKHKDGNSTWELDPKAFMKPLLTAPLKIPQVPPMLKSDRWVQ